MNLWTRLNKIFRKIFKPQLEAPEYIKKNSYSIKYTEPSQEWKNKFSRKWDKEEGEPETYKWR